MTDRPQLDFVCIGPQRTGSSWLDRALRTHPDIILPSAVKETFFFDRYFDRGWDWYFKHFRDGRASGVRGEVAPTCFESGEALQRLRDHRGDLRIIIMARDPVARTYSLLLHEYAKGRIGKDFEGALERLPRIADSGRYSVTAPLWEEVFGSANVLYIDQELLLKAPQEVFDRVCTFLGVALASLPPEALNSYGEGSIPRFWILAAIASRAALLFRSKGFHPLVNLGKRLGLKGVFRGGDREGLEMTDLLFRRLVEIHGPDIDFLAARLGRDTSHWRVKQ